MSGKKSDEWVCAVIIDDDDDDDLKLDEENVNEETFEITPISKRNKNLKPSTVEEGQTVVKKKKRSIQQPLKICFDNNTNIIEFQS